MTPATEHVKSHLPNYRNWLKKYVEEEEECVNGHGGAAALSDMEVRGDA